MTTVTEIAPDVFRIATFDPMKQMQFCQFVIKDDEPVLYHAGHKSLFPAIHEAVARLIDPAAIRWIGFSHFEADECGGLNQWLEAAPNATAFCTPVGVRVQLTDFAIRPARPLAPDEVLTTGRYRFRMLGTPHLPHCWEAGHLFEETTRTLYSSDLFHQNGDVEPITSSDVIERAREALRLTTSGPMLGYMPYTNQTDRQIADLAALRPQRIVPMHGSAFEGDGEQALRDLGVVMREVLDGPLD